MEQNGLKLWGSGAFFLPPQGVYYPVSLNHLSFFSYKYTYTYVYIHRRHRFSDFSNTYHAIIIVCAAFRLTHKSKKLELEFSFRCFLFFLSRGGGKLGYSTLYFKVLIKLETTNRVHGDFILIFNRRQRSTALFSSLYTPRRAVSTTYTLSLSFSLLRLPLNTKPPSGRNSCDSHNRLARSQQPNRSRIRALRAAFLNLVNYSAYIRKYNRVLNTLPTLFQHKHTHTENIADVATGIQPRTLFFHRL